jgi:hypothetical protein
VVNPVRALTRTVVVDGAVYSPGDVPPVEVAARIRNPQCWAPVTADPGINWTPEAGSGRVPEPDPAPGGLRNLDPQPADTDSSAVPWATPGTITGFPPAEPAVDQAVAPPADAPPPAAGEPVSEPDLLPEPPRSGRGATTAAWRSYAEQFNVVVPPEADRGDIITLLKDDGYIQ